MRRAGHETPTQESDGEVMTILCWIEVPDGHRAEILLPDGSTQRYVPVYPISESTPYRTWARDRPRDVENDPWYLPNDYVGLSIEEARESAQVASEWNEYLMSDRKKKKPDRR